MQTRTLLAAVATAAIAAIVTPSLSSAQDTTTKKTSAGEVAMRPSFGSLISAINSSSATNAKVQALTTVNAADVQLVNVEDLLKGNDVQALNNALTKNQADITALRTTLGGSQAFSTVLATADTSASAASSMSMKPAAKDVVAADVSPDGKVTLYYWKKPGGSDK
jgi:hypothetical protein